jgi:hypothetical protein
VAVDDDRLVWVQGAYRRVLGGFEPASDLDSAASGFCIGVSRGALDLGPAPAEPMPWYLINAHRDADEPAIQPQHEDTEDNPVHVPDESRSGPEEILLAVLATASPEGIPSARLSPRAG